MKLTFFTKPDCGLCGAAWFVVEKVARQLGVDVKKVDISAPGHERWYELYKDDIPVLHLDGQEICRHQVSESALRRRLEARSRGGHDQ